MEEAYRKSSAEVLQTLRVSPTEGLSKREADKRLTSNGYNELPKANRFRLIGLFLERFKDVLVLILVVAGVASILLGHTQDAIVIAIAILLDSSLSFLQVWRTEKTLARMRAVAEDTIAALRGGKKIITPSRKLVVGDIILFRAGENIPADARLVSASGLKAAEAALTGEANDVSKNVRTLTRAVLVADRINMVFAGTTITAGAGTAVVTATGINTEFGKIAQMLSDQPSSPSPLRRKLGKLGAYVGGALVAAIALLGITSTVLGSDIATTLRTTITLIVSAIPEDLTMILTIALTVGVSRILRSGGVVRKLESGETLGASTVICTDKTGTLTEGNMRATGFHGLQGDEMDAGQRPNHPLFELAYTGLILANGAEKVGDGYIGSATERTSLQFAEEAGFSRAAVRKAWRVRDTITFNTKWKYRAALADHPTQGSQTLFVMGAPDELLHKSSAALDGDEQIVTISAEKRAELTRHIEHLASQGKRLVALAVRRNLQQIDITQADVQGLTFLGVLAITDPVRRDVAKSIAETLSSGVAVKLITGDHLATAKAIGSQVGLPIHADTIMTGAELQALNDDELEDVIERISIFARIEPLDKQRIIRLLQKRGHIVAMTGDGINDAVALKGADIGVAMQDGSDVAREAADLVLLDNSFSTIVSAIKEGRVLRDNIRKVIAFLFATNAAEVAIFFVSILAGLPLPLLPAQILWINLVTDGTSDIALSLEPAETNVMKRPPEHPDAPLLSRTHVLHILCSGIVMTVATMALFWYDITTGENLTYARTMAFSFLATSSLLSVWSFRSMRETIFKRGILQNKWVLVSTGFSFALQLVSLYIPQFQSFFGTVPLRAFDWLIIGALSLVVVALIDARKLFLKGTMSAYTRHTKKPFSSELSKAAS